MHAPGRDERKRDALGRLFERLRTWLERTGALPPLEDSAAPAGPSAASAPAAAAALAHEPAHPPAQSDPDRGSGGAMPMGDSEQATVALPDQAQSAVPDQAQAAAPDEAQSAAAGQPARESLADLLSQPLPFAAEDKGKGEGGAKGKGEDPCGAGSGECDNPLVWTLLYLAQHYDRLGRTGAPFASTQAERVLVYKEVESCKGSKRCDDMMCWIGSYFRLAQHTTR